MWKDLETKTDLVNHRGIAAAVVDLVRDDALLPMTIGVHGDWGSGKSTVLEMVRVELAADEQAAVLFFNGWLFQGFEDAKIALMEAIVAQLQCDQRWAEKIKDGAIRLLKRINWLKVARKVAGATLAIPTGGGSLIADTALDAARDAVTGGDDDPWLKEAEERDVTRQIHEFRAEFQKLLADADIKRLVVVVDDLDRCLPAVAIETLEALRLFLFVDGTAFIIAADEALIEYAVRQHFPGIQHVDGEHAFTRNYLEKLIQVPFRLPPMNTDEARAYISLLFVEAALRNTPGAFEETLDALLQGRDEPWLPLRVDAYSVEASLPTSLQVDDALREQLAVAERVSRPLASGTKGNPRQLKRFLNTLMLRMRLARTYGITTAINEAVLAKLMLLERFEPTIYRALIEAVRASANGKIRDIDADSTHENGSAEDGGTLPEHIRKNAAFYEWASVEPKLRQIDLRPYLFVSREYSPAYVSQDGYGDIPANILRLVTSASLFDESRLERELSGLSSTLIARLFEKAVAELSSKTELRGDDGLLRGLGVIVRTNAELQEKYVNATAAFPAKSVGPSIPLHLRTVIRDGAALEKLAALENRWIAEGDMQLKEAVAVARGTATH